MDKVLTIMVTVFVAMVSAFLAWSVQAVLQNMDEHEQLRQLNCDNPKLALEWANKNTRYPDHQAYARQLFVACMLDGPKPVLGH